MEGGLGKVCVWRGGGGGKGRLLELILLSVHPFSPQLGPWGMRRHYSLHAEACSIACGGMFDCMRRHVEPLHVEACSLHACCAMYMWEACVDSM